VNKRLKNNKENFNFNYETGENTLRWALKTFDNKVAIASSFGAEDVVLIDMAVRIDPAVKIFTLDTGRLHQETYDVMDKIRERYNINIEVCFPDKNKVQEMVKKHGVNLFYESTDLRKLCCRIRKIEPLLEKLKDLDAWICGLRQEQAFSRLEIKKVENDHLNNIIKINPLADWTESDVWEYIRKNNVPYNKLHDIDFPSIGCAPCTRSISLCEDIRAGRWWWEEPEKKECGIHNYKT
jgi:phosphoadenosine phosphosulfate reductase